MGRTSRRNGAKLLELARTAIETRFTRKEINLERYQELSEKRGVFVTLTKDDELRGCIGYVEPIGSLRKGVVRAARAAAFDDPRFPALEPEELGSIRVEVSVLTVPKKVEVRKPEEYLTKLKVGRDGLIIRQRFHSGLLLPQVPVEYGWNIETYLEQLCFKAGLPRSAWKDKDTVIEAFQAEIFSET